MSQPPAHRRPEPDYWQRSIWGFLAVAAFNILAAYVILLWLGIELLGTNSQTAYTVLLIPATAGLYAAYQVRRRVADAIFTRMELPPTRTGDNPEEQLPKLKYRVAARTALLIILGHTIYDVTLMVATYKLLEAQGWISIAALLAEMLIMRQTNGFTLICAEALYRLYKQRRSQPPRGTT